MLVLCDLDILDIAASKYNVLELLWGGRDEVGDLSFFSAKRVDFLECDSRLFRIDFVKNTDVSMSLLELEDKGGMISMYLISLFEMRLNL